MLADPAFCTSAPARRLLAICALALLGACEPAVDVATPPEARLVPCHLEGVENEARCTDIRVPESRAPAARQRDIPIHVAVLPAAARAKRGDAVVILVGGPGQSATGVAAIVAPVFARLNRQRDIVLMDQRGTGESNPLKCPRPDKSAPLQAQFDMDALARLVGECHAALEAKGNDLSQYTTSAIAEDLEEVRRQLGYPRINLWGASYGTRVALEYIRLHPARVRTAVLDGVAPAGMKLPISSSLDAEVALAALTSACAADRACSAAQPDLGGTLDRLLGALDRGNVPVTVPNPVTGAPEQLSVDRRMFLNWLHGPLYTALTASLVPVALQRASHGDYSVLVAANAAVAGELDEDLAFGMHLSVVCSEDMARVTPDDVARLSGSHFGTMFYDSYARLCKAWPVPPRPDAFYAPVAGAMPVVMLSGGLDPATQAVHARDAAAQLTQVTQWLAPAIGHGVSSQGCTPDLIERFIRQGNATAIDASCLAKIPRPPFLESLVDVAP